MVDREIIKVEEGNFKGVVGGGGGVGLSAPQLGVLNRKLQFSGVGGNEEFLGEVD
jgi:hypothetical protein